MLDVVAKAPHKYADQHRLVGERYAIEDKLLPAMEYLGWVEPYDPKRHGPQALTPTGEMSRKRVKKAARGKPRKGRK